MTDQLFQIGLLLLIFGGFLTIMWLEGIGLAMIGVVVMILGVIIGMIGVMNET